MRLGGAPNPSRGRAPPQRPRASGRKQKDEGLRQPARCAMEWTRRFFSRTCWLRAPLGVFPCTPPKRAPLRGGAEGRLGRGLATFRAHTPNVTPPSLQSALVALGCALLLEARRAAASLQRPRRSARVLLAPRPQAPHTAHAIQRPAARPAAKRVRTALCATAGAAPGHHGGGGRPAPRPDAPRPREPAPVGAAASGSTPRAASGIRTPHCVSHPAPLGTPHRRGRSEPLDALTIAQRQARDAPHRRTPTERTGPRACAHNAS